MLLALMWLVSFVGLGNPELWARIGVTWLLGLVALLVLRVRGSKANRLQPVVVSALVLLLPGWTLLEVELNQASWDTALLTALGWGLAGTSACLVFWAATFLLVWVGVIGVFEWLWY